MITSDLYKQVLLEPYQNGANQLFIVSGYASAAMISRHLAETDPDNPIKLEIIIGMASWDGVSLSDHQGFQELSEKFQGGFICRYHHGRHPVHAKLYAWYCDEMPMQGFLGSANYTQRGFGKAQQEAFISCSASAIRDYYLNLVEESILCTDSQADGLIDFYVKSSKGGQLPLQIREKGQYEVDYDLTGLEHIRVSFLTRENDSKIPQRSGLNWGQRPGREPNQAYIPLPAEVYNSGFFPPIGEHFALITDDGETIFCTRAQQHGKAIHTPENNSILGKYFRRRIGLPEGSLVSLEDLQQYGRTDVDIYKIDEESYYLDFSASAK